MKRARPVKVQVSKDGYLKLVVKFGGDHVHLSRDTKLRNKVLA